MKYIIISFTIFFTLFACQEETLTTYQEEDNIYFDLSVPYVKYLRDSLDISFMYDPYSKTDSLINIGVKVMGNPSSQKREFAVSLSPSSTAVEGKHYTIESSVIEAGEVKGDLKIRLHRKEELKEERVSMFFQLEENDFFSIYYTLWKDEVNDTIYNPVHFNVFLSDMFIMPVKWRSQYHYYLGEFSEKKMRLTAELMNVPLEKFEDLTLQETLAYAQTLKRYLEKQKLLGEPVLEEDETLMQTGPYA